MSAPPINGRQASDPPAATVLAVLTRAARRYADEHNDDPAPDQLLAYLAAYVEPHVEPASVEVSNLRVRLADAEQSLAAYRAGHDQLTAELMATRRDLERLKRQRGRRAGAEQAATPWAPVFNQLREDLKDWGSP